MSDIFNTMTDIILEKVQQFQNKGSGWQFENIESFDIFLDPFQPLDVSTCIILPKKLAARKAIINVKNENDHECFKWAVTSAVYPKEKDPQRLNKMRLDSNNFNWDGIDFPVSQNQINKFERQNEYAMNVFGYERDKVYPLRISKKESKAIDLLLISNEKTNHYCWIKSKSKLLSSQVSNPKSARFFCDRCINHFPNKPALEKHLKYCSNHDVVRIEFPKKKAKRKCFLNLRIIKERCVSHS